MSVVVMLTLKAKPEAFEDMKAQMAETLKDTNRFEGCLGVYACADNDDHSLIVYERWTAPEAQQKYIAWRQERGDLDAMGEALRAAPTFETREDVFA